MKTNVKFFFYSGLSVAGVLLFLGCYSGSYRYYGNCHSINAGYSQHCGRYNKTYDRQMYYPYRYRNNSHYYGEYKHNPFHISPGRFRNFGRPSKWRF
ncbi:Putative lipoprotein [Leptospira santarosai]|uniref:Lipoprotein n=1 Tax=Leptospira santarosai TaxID=28183 RepID=A0A2P1QSV6_9LEPT|nr:Putative lipoprotein [Leptospira santarosai]